MVFSPKQRRVLTWWRPGSPDRDRQAILCDGAVRSGKTLCTGLSFFCWAMSNFRGKNFALCGRTIQSVTRNLLSELLPLLEGMGFQCRQKLSKNLIEVRLGKRKNTVYLFGGKDESSAALIEGMTLAGALLDLDGDGFVPAGEDGLTPRPGIFVAGDCRAKALRQLTTACADGAVAALAACRYCGA